MGLEVATTIAGLNSANPLSSDQKNQGDDHLRLIKAVLQADAMGLSTVHAGASKATPVDADEIPIVDSLALTTVKKLTWANLKATLKTYNDTLYATGGANSNITSLAGLTTPLSVAQGGTGAITLAANNVLLGNGVSAPQVVAPGPSGNVLKSNGTTWLSAAEQVETATTVSTTSGTIGSAYQTIAHGVGAIPKRFVFSLYVNTAVAGWAVGDEILMPIAVAGGAELHICWGADATYFYVVSANPNCCITHKSTGANVAVAVSNFKGRVRFSNV